MDVTNWRILSPRCRCVMGSEGDDELRMVDESHVAYRTYRSINARVVVRNKHAQSYLHICKYITVGVSIFYPDQWSCVRGSVVEGVQTAQAHIESAAPRPSSVISVGACKRFRDI